MRRRYYFATFVSVWQAFLNSLHDRTISTQWFVSPDTATRAFLRRLHNFIPTQSNDLYTRIDETVVRPVDSYADQLLSTLQSAGSRLSYIGDGVEYVGNSIGGRIGWAVQFAGRRFTYQMSDIVGQLSEYQTYYNPREIVYLYYRRGIQVIAGFMRTDVGSVIVAIPLALSQFYGRMSEIVLTTFSFGLMGTLEVRASHLVDSPVVAYLLAPIRDILTHQQRRLR